MIRAVFIASLIAVLMIVLYLPASRPAADFLRQVRVEHARQSEYWGQHHALAMLATMLDLQSADAPRPPLMPEVKTEVRGDSGVQGEVAAVSSRLLNNAYFRSLNALVLLAMYRAAILLHLLPAMIPFLLAALVDGVVRRNVKRTDFSGHNPEVFSACACGVIVVLCATTIAFVIPVDVSPLCMPVLLFLSGALLNRCISNYHKRS